MNLLYQVCASRHPALRSKVFNPDQVSPNVPYALFSLNGLACKHLLCNIALQDANILVPLELHCFKYCALCSSLKLGCLMGVFGHLHT